MPNRILSYPKISRKVSAEANGKRSFQHLTLLNRILSYPKIDRKVSAKKPNLFEFFCRTVSWLIQRERERETCSGEHQTNRHKSNDGPAKRPSLTNTLSHFHRWSGPSSARLPVNCSSTDRLPTSRPPAGEWLSRPLPSRPPYPMWPQPSLSGREAAD